MRQCFFLQKQFSVRHGIRDKPEGLCRYRLERNVICPPLCIACLGKDILCYDVSGRKNLCSDAPKRHNLW